MPQRPLIIDAGLYCSLAARLGEELECVYFDSEYNAFPIVKHTAPCTGIKNVEVIDDPIQFMLKGGASHVVTPDLYHRDWAVLAKKMGISVVSSGEAEELETDRWKLMEFLDQHNLPVIEAKEIEGIDALGRYLARSENADKYIKISEYRGDLETEHHVDWESSQLNWYLGLKERLGAFGNKVRFIAQEPIDAKIEVGIDTWFRNGQFAVPMLVGVEHKDRAYFGAVLPKPPPMFHPILDAFGPYLAKHGYNNFWSNEMRIAKNGTIYFTDATHRMPWPPSGVMMAACRNFVDVLLRGARPDFGDAKYLCELVFCSDAIATEWVKLDFPPSLKRNYAFHRYCIIEGKTWAIPHDSGFKEFGSALGWGATPEAAKEMCKEAAKALKGYQVKFEESELDNAETDLRSLI
jgi:hypothetical protein